MTEPESTFGRRERLRFVNFEFTRRPDGGCETEVTLELDAGSHFAAAKQAVGSEAAELRCAAETTLEAIGHAIQDAVSFELIGVKAVRAFDSVVLIVSLEAKYKGETHRLVGSFLAQKEPARGAAVAVLNATNRLLGNIFLRDER